MRRTLPPEMMKMLPAASLSNELTPLIPAAVARPPSPVLLWPPVAEDGGYDARILVDLADAVVLGVDDQQVSPAVEAELPRDVEHGRGRRTAVAGESGGALPAMVLMIPVPAAILRTR